MRRTLLIGVAIGAALGLAGAAIASIWFDEKPKPLHLRIVDDNFDYILAPKHRDEDGPISPRLARHCGIDQFTVDLAVPDHAGSTFVDLEKTPRAKINCLIGEARIHGLSLAIVDGDDRSNFECLPGWPSRFQRFDRADYGFCPRGEPNQVVGKGPALSGTDRW